MAKGILTDLSPFIVSPQNSLRETMVVIGKNSRGVALVTENRKLLYVLTDGDLRRAVLKGLSLDMTVQNWASQTTDMGRNPFTARMGSSSIELICLMRQHQLYQIPLLDSHGNLAGLALLSEFIQLEDINLEAVIMAGGKGSRLMPLTQELPKPMLPIGDKPLLEHTVQQLVNLGVKDVSLATFYKSDVIKNHFGDGQKFGIRINYLNEEVPLGTAGALGLKSVPKTTQLVMNGDILSQVDYRAMLQFHRENKAVMTVGVRQYQVDVPYGVVETNGVHVSQLNEKPSLKFFVNAGIYLLEPTVYQFIDTKSHLDMTELISRLLDKKLPVVSFPISEYWLDIGLPQDYRKAQQDAEAGHSKSLS